MGFAPGKLDGSIGPTTEAAIKSFQRAAKLKADGDCGKKTWGAIFDRYQSRIVELLEENPNSDDILAHRSSIEWAYSSNKSVGVT